MNSMLARARTKVLVVSMASAVERRAEFAKTAPPQGWWGFMDAFEQLHPSLTYEENDALAHIGRALTKGEIGCYSSHFEAWERLAADPDADRYIVLEDDVIPDWAFLSKLVESDVPHVDYLRLFYKRPTRLRVSKKGYIERTKALVELYGFAFGTQGYVISKTGAKRFIQHLKQVKGPIDDGMDRVWVHGVRNLAVFPFPLIERSIPSDIGGKRFMSVKLPAGFKLRRWLNWSANKARYYLGLLGFLCRR